MRFAICTELFEHWDLAAVCRCVADIGYTGIELAPFTLAPLVTDLSADQRLDVARVAHDAGLEVVGLHWLLAKTEGLHVSHPDRSVRVRTQDYLRALVHACADMSARVLVMGSPQQRNVLDGTGVDEAFNRAAETFRAVMPVAADRDVTICFEPLSPAETNFINTAADAWRLCQAVDHPHFRLHLDVKAMSAEDRPVPDLIREFVGRAGHVHANDANLRGPGMGDVDFMPIFEALVETAYTGWVSVEVFDYKPDPQTVARRSYEHMQSCLNRVRGRS